jgi:hypothetical protein
MFNISARNSMKTVTSVFLSHVSQGNKPRYTLKRNLCVAKNRPDKRRSISFGEYKYIQRISFWSLEYRSS